MKTKTSKNLVQGILMAALLASPLVAGASSHREPPIRFRTAAPAQQAPVKVLRINTELPPARR